MGRSRDREHILPAVQQGDLLLITRLVESAGIVVTGIGFGLMVVMRRTLAPLSLLTLLFGCAAATGPGDAATASEYIAPTDAIVLRIEVLNAESTDFYPPSDCPPGHTCIPFNFWTKYRARVVDVLSGTWESSQIEFAHLQHGTYRDEVTWDCYVVLRPAKDKLRSTVGVHFVADRLLLPVREGDRAVIKALRKGA